MKQRVKWKMKCDSSIRILICLKIIRRTVDNEELYMLNPNDANVLEMALKMKDYSKNIHISVISMGPEAIATKLKELYSYQIDSVVMVTDSCYVGSDTLATSYILTCAAQHLGEFDIIMCGCHSSDGNTGQVAPEIAARMGRMLISCVSDMELEEKGVACNRITDRTVQHVKAGFPLVVTCVRNCNELRIPTFWDIMRAERKDVVALTNADLELEKGKCGMEGSATRVESTVKVFHSQKGEVVALDEEAVQKMIKLLRSAGGGK